MTKLKNIKALPTNLRGKKLKKRVIKKLKKTFPLAVIPFEGKGKALTNI